MNTVSDQSLRRNRPLFRGVSVHAYELVVRPTGFGTCCRRYLARRKRRREMSRRAASQSALPPNTDSRPKTHAYVVLASRLQSLTFPTRSLPPIQPQLATLREKALQSRNNAAIELHPNQARSGSDGLTRR